MILRVWARAVGSRALGLAVVVLMSCGIAACGNDGGSAEEPLGTVLLGFAGFAGFGGVPGGQVAFGTDTTLTELQSTNYGASPKVSVRGDGSTNPVHVGLIKWTIAGGAPSCNHVVTSASITLEALSTTGQAYNIYPAQSEWIANQANWTHRMTGVPWEVPGAMGSADRGPALQQFTPSAVGPVNIGLGSSGVALVQSWLNDPSSNKGIVIGHPTNTDGFSVRSFDGNGPRPLLQYTFFCAQ